MALVADMVARFSADTSAYVEGIERAKAKNKEIAESIIKAAGDTERAMATITVARKQGRLGELGIDPKQVNGVIGQIKSIEKEMKNLGAATDQGFKGLRKGVAGSGDLLGGFGAIAQGNTVEGIKRVFQGINDLAESSGGETGEKFAKALNGKLGANLAKGGITLIALGIAGEALKNLTAKALELRDAFESGKKSAGEVAIELGKTLPVLGSLVEAGANINELMTGDLAYAARIKSGDELVWATRAKVLQITQDITKANKDWADSTQAVVQQNQVLFLELAGKHDQAVSLKLSFDTAKAIQDAKDAYAKTRTDLEKEIQDTVNGTSLGKTDEKGLTDSVAAMKAKQQEAIEHGKQVAAGLTGKDYDASFKAGKEDHFSSAEETTLAQLQSSLEKIRKAKEQIASMKDGDDGKPNKALQAKIDEIQKGADVTGATEIGRKLTERLVSGIGSVAGKGKGVVDSIFGNPEDMKKQAEAMVEAAKTPLQKMQDDIQQAVALKRDKMLSDSDLKSILQGKANDLVKQKADLEKDIGGGQKDLYSLPNQKEYRGGVLYAPPQAKADDQKIDLLKQINDGIAALKDTAASQGIAINVQPISAA